MGAGGLETEVSFLLAEIAVLLLLLCPALATVCTRGLLALLLSRLLRSARRRPSRPSLSPVVSSPSMLRASFLGLLLNQF